MLFLINQQYFYMENSRYIIRKQFLDPTKYQHLLEHTYTYESLFKTWLGQITDNYRGSQKRHIYSLPSTLSSQEFTKESFENLVNPFITKLYNISTEHLIYVSSIMRHSNSVSLERDFDRTLEKIKSLNDCHHSFSNTYRDLLSAENRIVLEPTHNVEFYYYSNWFKRLNALQKYSKSLKYIQDAKPDKERLYKISEEVQQEFLQLRKKIMDYKYGYLKQGVKISRQLLKCLSEYLTIGIQILSKINGKIKMQLASDKPNPKGLRYSGSILETDHMDEFRENYQIKAEEFRKTLSRIQNLFQYRNPEVDKKSLFDNFTLLYSGNEDLLTEMFDVYTLFETMSNRRKIMNERLSLILSKMDSQHKSKKKVAEVLHTLNKRRTLEDEKMLACSIEDRRSRQFINQQFDIKNILKSVSDSIEYSLKCFMELSEMCYKCSLRSTQQRQVDTNMEISYQYKQIKIKVRKPCQQEIWLWKDWRQFKIFAEIQPKYDEKTISKQLAEIKSFMQEADDTGDKISCTIQGRNSSKASLEIFPEKIQVLSKKQSTSNFIFPFKFVEYVEPKKKNLVIKMHGGSELVLSGLKNLAQTEKKINERFLTQDGNQNNQNVELLPLKPYITITKEQLESIQKRTTEMKKIIPDQKQYTKYIESTIKGITIQEVYQNIYSDKDSCPLSKNRSFFSYANQKSGNYNVTSSKYDKEGPYFFTQSNKDITFLNCPLVSVRIAELNHPLPPIPFLPKAVHCKSEQSIFWISDKELQYKADVSSYGSKMMESLYTSTLYYIKQVDDGVKIQIWCKIWFKQGASMKSILENGALGQIKNIVPEVMKNIEKCCRLAIKARARVGHTVDGNKAEEIIEEQQIEKEKEKKVGTTEQEQQSKINRTIILLIVGTILMNILINFVF